MKSHPSNGLSYGLDLSEFSNNYCFTPYRFELAAFKLAQRPCLMFSENLEKLELLEPLYEWLRALIVPIPYRLVECEEPFL